NLYDLSIAFSFGAAFATLLVSHRESTRFIGAFSFPLISLILLLAIFIGSNFIDLPPVLDSYWRPIHVGVASMSYGVALVSFVLAVMYLLKDGMKIESMAFAAAVFIFIGFAGFSQSYDHLGLFKENVPFGSISYRMSPVLLQSEGAMSTGARVEVPWVGELMTLTLILMLGVAICFWLYNHRNNESAKRWGHRLLRASIIPQGGAIAMAFFQINNIQHVGQMVGDNQFYTIGKTLLRDKAAGMSVDQIVERGAGFMQNYRDALVLNIKGNPV